MIKVMYYPHLNEPFWPFQKAALTNLDVLLCNLDKVTYSLAPSWSLTVV